MAMARMLTASLAVLLQFSSFQGAQGVAATSKSLRAHGATVLLDDDQCRKQVAQARHLEDGCQCLVPAESSRNTFDLKSAESSPPHGVELRQAGSKGVGLFATSSFSKGESIGWAYTHTLPCNDFKASTSQGPVNIYCDTHFFPLRCGSKGPGENYGVFPEWLDLLNHADEGVSTAYFGPSEFVVSSDGRVLRQRWKLVASRTIKPDDELTYDYCYGFAEFRNQREAVEKLSGLRFDLAADTNGTALIARAAAKGRGPKSARCLNSPHSLLAHSHRANSTSKAK